MTIKMKFLLSCAWLLALLTSVSAHSANDFQNLETLFQLAKQYVSTTPNLAGQQIEVLRPNPNLRLSACEKLEVSTQSTGIPVNNNIRLVVQCKAPKQWSTYLNARLLNQEIHHHIRPDTTQTNNASNYSQPNNPPLTTHALPTIDQAYPPNSNTFPAPIQEELGSRLKPGQTVKILYSGHGFHIMNEGQLLTGGVIGQTVKVRTQSRQIINAIIKESDLVEVTGN
jgi:flagella basal body P-ring formation protein FlgA